MHITISEIPSLMFDTDKWSIIKYIYDVVVNIKVKLIKKIK